MEMAWSSNAALGEDLVDKYEDFIENTLRKDLDKVLLERGKYETLLADLDALAKNLRSIIENGDTELRTLVELGTDVHAQAHVADTSHVFIACGLGFHVEVTLQEALEHVIPLQREEAQQHKEALSQQAAYIKAQIRFIQDGIKNVTGLGSKELL